MMKYDNIEELCARNKEQIERYLEFESGNTVYSEARSVKREIAEMEAQLNEIELGMMYHKGSALADLKDAYNRLYQEFEDAGGYSYEERIEEALFFAGFEERDFIKPVGALSEQQKLRLAAAKYLLSQPRGVLE